MSIVDPIDIEKEEHVFFNPGDWITKGKDYKGAPLHVQNARTAANTLPLDVLRLLPDNDTPFSISFISHSQPNRQHSTHLWIMAGSILKQKPEKQGEIQLVIPAEDAALFKKLKDGIPRLISGMQTFSKRMKDKGVD